MTYPIRDVQEYQNERLQEAEQYRLIKLAKRGRPRPQRWQWIYDKSKEVLSLIESSITVFQYPDSSSIHKPAHQNKRS